MTTMCLLPPDALPTMLGVRRPAGPGMIAALP